MNSTASQIAKRLEAERNASDSIFFRMCFERRGKEIRKDSARLLEEFYAFAAGRLWEASTEKDPGKLPDDISKAKMAILNAMQSAFDIGVQATYKEVNDKIQQLRKT